MEENAMSDLIKREIKREIEREIKGEIEKIRRKYKDSAYEIVSGYHREYSLSKDYEGRQIFELLQNADDEATDSNGKVLITFDGKTLSVSNTGNAFSFQGVKSLLYPNASPKKVHANKIGCKGLGFRSILTWSDSVTVASEHFTIKFSKDYAKEFLSDILDEKPELKKEIETLSREEFPIAILTCPHLMQESALVEGFSTSIIMECRDDLSGEIEEQIENLEFEELVFLPNLKEIEIICNDYHKVFYKVVDGDDVIIETADKNTNESECASWTLYNKNGVIKDENGNDSDYEFIIAYDSSGKHYGEVLYSYFKTDIKLGFPALIHGTFELTSDRNSLQKQSMVNKQLIPLLADFMVQTAIRISEKQKECDYRPLSLVITSDMDIVLKNEYGFDKCLRDKVYKEKILPTIANKYISINDMPRYSDKNFADILNPEVFSTILKLTDSDFIKKYLQSDLNIKFFDYDEFCKLLNSDVEYYSMKEKVKLISLINREYKDINKEVFPHLIVDSNGDNIYDALKVYPFPNDEQVIALPDWVNIRFLNQEMEQMLNTELGSGNNRRGLVSALAKYNLEEYSFDKLLRGMVNQANEEIISKDKCSDILNWLWKYYNPEERQAFSDVKVKVICRDGEIRYAKECYIGNEYGNELGERLIGLFSDNFVSLNELKIDCEDTNRIAGFLEWLGVSKYPRIIKKTLSYDERENYLNSCYPLYVQRDNHSYSKSEFNSISNITVGIFEYMDTIFEKADFNDLLAWFLLDNEIGSRLNTDTEEKNHFSSITGRPCKKQEERVVLPSYMKSYLRYYLSNVKWIPNKNGEKEIPLHCCFEDNSLSPFITVPNIDYTYIKKIVGRTCKKDVDAILSRIGIADVFQEMDKCVIYQTLIKLPELDPEFKKARSLYRKIIREGLTPDEYKVNNPYYEEFIKSGKVVARKNGRKCYVPVSEVRYADKKVFSYEILKSFSMFDIDARSGEDKVKKLFGVEPLKYTNAKLESKPELHPFNEAFQKEYIRFMPFVFACRMGLKNANTDFSRLKSSKIILCTKITIKYKFVNETSVSDLKDYETVYLRNNNIAYLCVPNKFATFNELKQVFEFADSVAELITDILDVNEDKDFFRDLFRDTDYVREKKMRSDKGDDNLDLLTEARKKFNSEVNPRNEFWMTIAEISKLPDIKITSSTANELISALHLPSDIDAEVHYDNLNSSESIKTLIHIFDALQIDIEQYNERAVHNIDATKYWSGILKTKMTKYMHKYQAYIIDHLQDNDNCIERYDQLKEKYDFLEPNIKNSLFINIDKVFEDECGVSFEVLDKYTDNAVNDLIETEKARLSEEDLNRLQMSYSPQKIEAYLVFGKINELINFTEQAAKETEPKQVPDNRLEKLLNKVFDTPTEGFFDVSTQTEDNEQTFAVSGKHRKHTKKIHSALTDKIKQEIGIIGEACVYKELRKLYPDSKWVSGNAEKAGYIINGDDTCGYDIKYTDECGNIQYVEVKSSKSDKITFFLSDSELHFGCQNASSYEIIYVVIGDDGLPAHKPWRLGHLFNFSEGEDLLHNNRFSIESDSYRVVAKIIED